METFKVYFLGYLDRGVFHERADAYGVWLSEDLAQNEADKRNQQIADSVREGMERLFKISRAQWVKRRHEHNALKDVGLRDGEFKEPEPQFPDLTLRKHYGPGILVDGVRIHDYWEVGSYTLNDVATDDTMAQQEAVRDAMTRVARSIEAFNRFRS